MTDETTLNPDLVGCDLTINTAPRPGFYTVTTGTYLGVFFDDEAQENYHYFRGGAINDTDQGADGMHGFPVDRKHTVTFIRA